MIDPLPSAAPPLPARTQANETSAGVPSFLPWALGVPGQTGQGGQDGQNDAHLPQPDAGIDPSTLQARIAIGTADLATTGISPSLPSTLAIDSALETLDSVQWRERVSTVVEFHLRNPQGERELVAMPWRLVASGRLAQSLGARGFIDPAAAIRNAYAGNAVASTPVASVQSAAGIRHAMAAGLPGDALEGAPMPLAAAPRAIGVEDRATLPSLSSPSPVAAEWLARWMKWIERDGHDPIVLLRDFRIDDDEARRLVDGLRAFAQEHGVALDRVVVNGREFWRRSDLSQPGE